MVPGILDLGLVVERLTAGGEPFGLHVPQLAKGRPADVCLVDLASEWEVGEAGYESRSANCAFAGRRLTGRVRMTIAGRRRGLPRAFVRDRGRRLMAVSTATAPRW